MAKGLNKIMIIGNLGRDPEMRYTPTGKPITSFSVVVERERGASDWFTVVAWDGLAEACNEQLERDALVYVEGRLQTRSFQKDGQKHYRSEVVAEVVMPLGGSEHPALEEAATGAEEALKEESPSIGEEGETVEESS